MPIIAVQQALVSKLTEVLPCSVPHTTFSELSFAILIVIQSFPNELIACRNQSANIALENKYLQWLLSWDLRGSPHYSLSRLKWMVPKSQTNKVLKSHKTEKVTHFHNYSQTRDLWPYLCLSPGFCLSLSGNCLYSCITMSKFFNR